MKKVWVRQNLRIYTSINNFRVSVHLCMRVLHWQCVTLRREVCAIFLSGSCKSQEYIPLAKGRVSMKFKLKLDHALIK